MACLKFFLTKEHCLLKNTIVNLTNIHYFSSGSIESWIISKFRDQNGFIFKEMPVKNQELDTI